MGYTHPLLVLIGSHKKGKSSLLFDWLSWVGPFLGVGGGARFNVRGSYAVDPFTFGGSHLFKGQRKNIFNLVCPAGSASGFQGRSKIY